MPVTRELLKPVSPGFIIFTFVVGVMSALIPWGPTTRFILPDAVPLLLLYWAMNQPRYVGVGSAFILGLILDITDGNAFGQHGLAYCISTYLVLARHRQLTNFPLWQQALYVGPLLLVAQCVTVLSHLVMGDAFPGWLYFSSSLTGALFWPALSRLLQAPQRKTTPVEL